MDDKSLLELCLSISGAFENGAPDYKGVTGNFDGQGISVGVLQWNAGQGSLQTLLLNIGSKMGWDKAQTFFKSDIHHLAVLKPTEAIQFCVDHYLITNSTHISPDALTAWQTFLSQPESIAAQIEMATNGVLFRAKTLAAKFCPGYETRTRVLTFFFDLVTQSGGMENKQGKVEPTVPTAANVAEVLTYAGLNHVDVKQMWSEAIQNDPLAQLLLHYAYARSELSKAAYMWDACSRRGTIACRKGIVHGKTLDFTLKLD
jgi:hypothetical protein